MKLSRVVPLSCLRLLACTASVCLPLTAGCQSTNANSSPPMLDLLKQHTAAAFDEMRQQMAKGNGGQIPEEMRVAFVPIAKSVEYEVPPGRLALFGVDSETKRGQVKTTDYPQRMLSYALEENQRGEVQFNEYDQSKLNKHLAELDLESPEDLLVPSKATQLRELCGQDDPLDGLVFLVLSGTQDGQNPRVEWEVQSKFVDIRPQATKPRFAVERWWGEVKANTDVDFDAAQGAVATVAGLGNLLRGGGGSAGVIIPEQPSDAPKGGNGSGKSIGGLPVPASTELEPNGDISTLMKIAANQSMQGQVGGDDKEDWYRFQPEQSGTASLLLQSKLTQGTNAVQVNARLMPATGANKLTQTNWVGVGGDHTSPKVHVESGKSYYIIVQSRNPNQPTAKYGISLQFEVD